MLVLYLWDFIAEAAEQQGEELVEVGVSVPQVEEPITNHHRHSSPHLDRRMERDKNKHINIHTPLWRH